MGVVIEWWIYILHSFIEKCRTSLFLYFLASRSLLSVQFLLIIFVTFCLRVRILLVVSTFSYPRYSLRPLHSIVILEISGKRKSNSITILNSSLND